MSSSVHVFKATVTIAVIASGMPLIFPPLAYAVGHEFWPEYAGWAALSILLAMLAITAAAWRQWLFGRLVFDERLGVIEQRGVSPFRLAFSAVKIVRVEADLRSDDPPYGSIKIVGATGETYLIREVFFGTATQTTAIIQLMNTLFRGRVHEI
jgi:hypothetical protein